MALEIKVPAAGESVTEVTLAKWIAEDGAYVAMDEILCELESDKATLELPAEQAGIVKHIVEEGADIDVGTVICEIDTSAKPPANAPKPKAEAAPKVEATPAKAAEAPSQPAQQTKATPAKPATYASGHPAPAAAKLIAENNLDAARISGSGKDGRITKSDVLSFMENGSTAGPKAFSREVKREQLSRLRRTIADHLVAAKNTTAMLTTFNEVNMKPLMDLRTKYKKAFEEEHGARLGFMSFFIKAVCNGLREFPAVNAQIEGKDIIYHDYCDVSIAVSTPRGLVVPVIRNAESLSIAQLEQSVYDLAIRGRDNKLSMEDMEGGTFTVSNGGVFGSLMSTPILNAPQSAILGMHKIEERPIAENGQVVIKPMMYLALSYDHRIIDGKESVSFLVRVKENLENPEMMLTGRRPVEDLLGV